MLRLFGMFSLIVKRETPGTKRTGNLFLYMRMHSLVEFFSWEYYCKYVSGNMHWLSMACSRPECMRRSWLKQAKFGRHDSEIVVKYQAAFIFLSTHAVGAF